MQSSTEQAGVVTPSVSSSKTLPGWYWSLWAGAVVNRLGAVSPAFIALYLTREGIARESGSAIAISLFGAGSLVAALLGGAFADTLGPRPVIVRSQIALVAIAIVLVLSRQLWMMWMIVSLLGLTVALHRPASVTLISELLSPSAAERAYGLLYWAWNIGGSISPILAGFILSTYPRALFVLPMVSGIVYSVVGLTLPADARRRRYSSQQRSPLRQRSASMVKDVLAPFSSPVMAATLGLSFVLASIYLQRQGALPLAMEQDGLGPREVGLVLGFNGLLVIVLQPFVSSRTVVYPYAMLLSLAAGLIGVGYGFNAFVSTFAGYIGALVIWTLGEIVWVPTSMSFTSSLAEDGRFGSYHGAYFFSWSLALVVGTPVGVALLSAVGSTRLWFMTFALALLVAAGYALVARAHRPSPSPDGQERPRTRGPSASTAST